MDYVVLIGSSTGGPKALVEVVPHLPADLNAAYLIVQHMPVGFTASLAERLNKASEIEVKEAQAGDVVKAGTALLAPGGFHMEIGARNMIKLGEGPPECGVRPAIDVTARHAAKAFGGKMRSVILTGMGSDGTEGSRAIKAAGGLVLAEHKSTCAVYGMPKSVAEAGLTDQVAPLRRIANHIVSMCGSTQKVAV
jgi:two-component system chemotaxis response regulator CheB